MLAVIVLVSGAVVTWIVVDHVLAARDDRLRRGNTVWLGSTASHGGFRSTGFEDTLPPALADAAATSHRPTSP